MRTFGRFLFVPSLLSALLSGCAHSANVRDQELASMHDEISRLQAERDRVDERLTTLEVERVEKSRGPQPMARPEKLKVVRVGPEIPEPDSGDVPPQAEAVEDETGSRPVLRLSGEGGGGRRRSSDAKRGGESKAIVAFASDDAKASSSDPKPSALDPDARRAYDSALDLHRKGKYAAADDAFAAFLVKWPDHPYASNAMFWRGETFLARGDASRAVTEFEGVVSRFPLSNKLPDTLLKLGMAYAKLGNQERANLYYTRLKQEFPESEPARRIPR